MKLSALLIVIIHVFLSCSHTENEIFIANNGKKKIYISVSTQTSTTIDFASEELARYIEKISGVLIDVRHEDIITGAPAMRLVSLEQDGDEQYSIYSDSKIITLTGYSDRALLYAVYDFLERLGCIWLSPDFDFYNGQADFIPQNSTLSFPKGIQIIEKPSFKYRKLDTGEGRSLDFESLGHIIDWMPKAKLNILMVPADLNLRGRAVWANYRDHLPDLEKRGIMIEVGQHGYQNFLNARMEDGQIFKQHPEWFGKDDQCQPATSDEVIFNLENKDAVNYFIDNIITYLKQHPEIEIFDLWPPDYAKWNECPRLQFDLPHIRHARLVEQVRIALLEVLPDRKLQIIAFAKTLEPYAINENVMVDVCPIDQNFEKQIFDPSSLQNARYADAIQSWREVFNGDLGVYTYYRKYAWRSLPNIIPNYMQKDLQWFAGIPLQGISCYAEPGDWGTYELNHFILSKLEWNPNVNVDSLIVLFCQARYDQHWETAKATYQAFEEIVRVYGNIRHSTLKPETEIHLAYDKLIKCLGASRDAMETSHESVNLNLARLVLMIEYAIADLNVQMARARPASDVHVKEKISELMSFQQKNAYKGILIYNPNLTIDQLQINYNR